MDFFVCYTTLWELRAKAESPVFIVILVLPPVLVPRQSEYPRPPPPLPSPFRSADDPPMPYNASYPFSNRPNQLEHSPASSFDMPGIERRL